jgi:DNA-binding winged helix-turn-helix (wHTH) protein
MPIYSIGNMDFDPDACEIYREGQLEHLQPQVRNVLMCLVRHHGEVVIKDVLINEAWCGRSASDECLTRCISILRKQTSDRGDRHLIETIPKVGYRLHCTVYTLSAISGTGGGSIVPTASTARNSGKSILLFTTAIIVLALFGGSLYFVS